MAEPQAKWSLILQNFHLIPPSTNDNLDTITTNATNINKRVKDIIGPTKYLEI